jgi:type I restriction enzyme, S subunit
MTKYRFDQIAENIRVPVLPSDTDLKRYVGLEHLDPESLKLRRWGNPSDVIGQKLRFWKGDIIYGKRRAYQRKLAVADFDGICSAHAFVLRAKPDVCLPVFFPFFLQSELFHQRALEISVGSLSPTINWSTLAKQGFPLPPVEEQRRIADLLWAADDVIVRNQEVVEKLLTIQKWQLDNWLIDKNLNSDWQEVKLEDVCDIQNGQVDPKQLPYSEMIHIASDDIEAGTGRILEMNTAAQDKVISGNYLFTEKAIVYSKIRPNLKKVVFPKFTGVCSADVYPIYPRENIHPELLFQLLLSETFTQYATSQSARSAIPKINRNGLLAFKFRLPPMEVQEKLTGESSSVFQALESAKQHVENSRALKRELLNKVMNA